MPSCYSLTSGNDVHSAELAVGGRAHVPVMVSYPLVVAAVDPGEEAKLVGLDAATAAGRALTAADTWTPATYVPGEYSMPGAGSHPPYAPAVLASGQDADYPPS